MGLLQTTFLFALAALAIPLGLHLFSRWQSQKIELGTIRFLREVLTENVHRRRIRRWFLLATRMLMLSVLALLFARPFFIESTSRDGDRRRLILIDRSASMAMRGTQGKSIDVAIQKAAAAANEVGEDAKIQWAWFDSQVHPFQPRDGRSLASASPSPLGAEFARGFTSYRAAIAWARDRLAEDNRAKSDVVLITDLQRQGLGDPTDTHFPPDVPVQIIDVGRDAASNLAVSRIELAIAESKPLQTDDKFDGKGNIPSGKLRSDSEGSSDGKTSDRTIYNPSLHGLLRPDQTLFVQTTFFNYGAVPLQDVPVSITARQGSKTAKVRTTIDAMPEQATESQVELGKLGIGEWEITVEADVDDDLAIDNRRLHAVAVDDPPKILIVGTQDSIGVTATSSFFVNKALREGLLRDQPRFSVQGVSYSDALQSLSSPMRWQSIVLADATNVDASLIPIIENYVAGGGHVLAFTGQIGGEGGAAQWNHSPLAPGLFERIKNAGVVPFRLTANQPSHAILQPFDDPQTGDLQRLLFRKVVSLRLSSSAKQLASFDSDLPGIVELAYKKGRIVWFMSDAGDAWSNWTSSPLYLPLMHQMVSDLAGLIGEGTIQFRTVGDARIVANEDSSSESDSATLSQVSLSSDKPVESEFDNVGCIREGKILYVVNTREGESDTARIPEEELRKAYGMLAPRSTTENATANAAGVIANTQVKSIKKQELWHWLAALMVLLLVFEFGLSNRTPP